MLDPKRRTFKVFFDKCGVPLMKFMSRLLPFRNLILVPCKYIITRICLGFIIYPCFCYGLFTFKFFVFDNQIIRICRVIFSPDKESNAIRLSLIAPLVSRHVSIAEIEAFLLTRILSTVCP